MKKQREDPLFLEFINASDIHLTTWAFKRWKLIPPDFDEFTLNDDSTVLPLQWSALKSNWSRLTSLISEQRQIRTILDDSEKLKSYLQRHNLRLTFDMVNGQLVYKIKDTLLAKALYGEDTEAEILRSLVSFITSDKFKYLKKCPCGCERYFVDSKNIYYPGCSKRKRKEDQARYQRQRRFKWFKEDVVDFGPENLLEEIEFYQSDDVEPDSEARRLINRAKRYGISVDDLRKLLSSIPTNF